MSMRSFGLVLELERFAVCRLNPEDTVPSWATEGTFSSITRTQHELSIVCDESMVPSTVRAEVGWAALRVAGTIDFKEIGVVASLATSLADAGIGLFTLSTFDTDYLFVKEDDLPQAIEVLHASGHCIQDDKSPGC